MRLNRGAYYGFDKASYDWLKARGGFSPTDERHC